MRFEVMARFLREGWIERLDPHANQRTDIREPRAVASFEAGWGVVSLGWLDVLRGCPSWART